MPTPFGAAHKVEISSQR